ncbi:MAG: TMEM165/GDT1 family protein [Cyanobacteriota bacterium]|nr:TMEM165/GDT1 family protein [Cyanobacteriota bacterium]
MTSIDSRDRADNIEPSSCSPPEPNLSQPQSERDRARINFWAVFSSTFVTIFLAEIGDKTQLAILLMSAQADAPWIVFVGAAVALISTSLIGVLLGYWLSKRVSVQTMNLLAGATLLMVSVLLLWDVVQG